MVSAKVIKLGLLMAKGRKAKEDTDEKIDGKKSGSTSGKCSAYLGRFQEAPQFSKDNEHIFKGYRIGFETPKTTIKTLFMIHNETVNIWTHLIGFIILFFLIFEVIAYEMEKTHIMGTSLINDLVAPYKAIQSPQQIDPKLLCDMLNEGLEEGQPLFECQGLNVNSTQERPYNDEVATWPIMIMLAGSAICLACSATFHLIYQMNEKIFKISASLDYAGIGINMAFSPIPCFYYSLYCHQSTSTIYITLIFLAGSATFMSQMIEWFKRKSVLFVLSSVICVVGLVHLIINEFLYGNYGDQYSIVPSLHFFIPALLSYACGFYTYVSKCPERYQPGKFDICGHSHQIWHVFIFIAILLTYLGSLACYELRSQWNVCPAIDPLL